MIIEILERLRDLALLLPAFLVALSFHECAHALMAYLLGDGTAKKEGRLTLNPLAHIDYLGLLFLMIFRFGWAKPVTFDQRNFKHPRLYPIFVAFAGPLANFILALGALYCCKYGAFLHLGPAALVTWNQIFGEIVYVNVMLGIFNILPIPPLDGGHVIVALFIDKYPEFIAWLYRYSIFILLFLFLLPQANTFFAKTIIRTIFWLSGLVF